MYQVEFSISLSNNNLTILEVFNTRIRYEAVVLLFNELCVRVDYFY